MHAFDSELCSIPRFWCGDSDVVPARKRGDDSYYIRAGTRRECLMAGFGAGSSVERSKNLPASSLQKIKFIGEAYETKFKQHNINNIQDLLEYSRWSATKFEALINEILTKKNGVIDKKARNSVLLHLHKLGADNLPACDRL